MVWTKFPNQINDLLKLRRALSLASQLTAHDLRDDGVYGEALLLAGVIQTGKTPDELASLPNSRQPHRTTARGLRQHFILLGCMVPCDDGVELTSQGKMIAAQEGEALTATEAETWRELISQLRFPHSLYPELSEGVSGMRPAQVMLAMLERGPLPAQGLAVAFSVADESAGQITAARDLATKMSSTTISEIASQIGTTEAEVRNNAKVFPGLMEQVGLIHRESGRAWIETEGLVVLGAPGPPAQSAPHPTGTPTPRAISKGQQRAWAPEPSDPADLAERARMRMLRQERASIDHQSAVADANDWLLSNGFDTFQADYDIWACREQLWLLIEVKSLGAASVRRQTISAIGQLAYYKALSIPTPPGDVQLIRAVLFDRDPRDQQALDVLRAEDIDVMWISEGKVQLLSADLRSLILQ